MFLPGPCWFPLVLLHAEKRTASGADRRAERARGRKISPAAAPAAALLAPRAAAHPAASVGEERKPALYLDVFSHSLADFPLPIHNETEVL